MRESSDGPLWPDSWFGYRRHVAPCDSIQCNGGWGALRRVGYGSRIAGWRSIDRRRSAGSSDYRPHANGGFADELVGMRHQRWHLSALGGGGRGTVDRPI